METRATKRRRHQYAEACLNSTDPITMEPLDPERSVYMVKEGHVHGADASGLLEYIRSSGKAENPFTHDPLDDRTLQDLSVKCGVPLRDVKGLIRENTEVITDDVAQISIAVASIQAEVDAIINALSVYTPVEDRNALATSCYHPLALSVMMLRGLVPDEDMQMGLLQSVFDGLADLGRRACHRGASFWVQKDAVDYVAHLLFHMVKFPLTTVVMSMTGLAESVPED